MLDHVTMIDALRAKLATRAMGSPNFPLLSESATYYVELTASSRAPRSAEPSMIRRLVAVSVFTCRDGEFPFSSMICSRARGRVAGDRP